MTLERVGHRVDFCTSESVIERERAVDLAGLYFKKLL